MSPSTRPSHRTRHMTTTCSLDLAGRYFRVCPSRFGLSEATSVVLLEMEPEDGLHAYGGPNFGPPDGAVLHAAQATTAWARVVRRFAPNAWLGYVGWPGMKPTHHGPVAEAAFSSQLKGQIDAATFALPLIFAANLSRAHWYAEDRVHPNRDGHALLGELAASLIYKQLSSTGDSCARPIPHERQAAPSDSAHAYDLCALDARDLPLSHQGDFTLRDEGGAKGVKKLGYVSTVPGAQLTIGPLVPQVNCALFEASLGYLSSWRPGMGAFDVSCHGCECKPYAGAWAPGYHFPRVDTGPSRDPKDIGSGLNVSLSLFNKFLLYKTAETCSINVTHVLSPSPSRIRIDSLGLHLASCGVSCELTKRPWTRQFGVSVRSTCYKGAQAGRAGFLVPSCFNKSIVCKVVTGHPEFDL